MDDRGPLQKSTAQGWALTNFGILVHFAHRRREAIQYAEELSGQPWVQCKKFYEVRKAQVIEEPPHE